MTITAYTTQNISADNLAAAVAVMDAMRTGGDDFTASFGSHSAIDNAEDKQDGIAFTVNMSGLSADTDIEIYRGKSHGVTVHLTAGEKMNEKLADAMPSAQSSKPTTGPDMSPKK